MKNLLQQRLLLTVWFAAAAVVTGEAAAAASTTLIPTEQVQDDLPGEGNTVLPSHLQQQPQPLYPSPPPYPIPTDLMAPKVASTRTDRFPSVEDRIKLYMSDWYVPPCPEFDEGKVHYRYIQNNNSSSEWPTVLVREPLDRGENATTFELESAIQADKAFFLDRDMMLECSRYQKEEKNNSTTNNNNTTTPIIDTGDPRLTQRIIPRWNMFLYCSDVARSLLTAHDHLLWESTLKQQQQQQPNTVTVIQDAPILLQFGDLKHSHVYRFMNLPHIKKFRSATTRTELERVTTRQPNCIHNNHTQRIAIETPHTTTDNDDEDNVDDLVDDGRRHFQPIVWKLATSRHFRLLYKVHRDDTVWDDKFNMAVFRGQLTGISNGEYDKYSKSDVENCLSLMRCRLVYQHANSRYVHARLTSTRNRLPDVLNGVPLKDEAVTIRKLLQFKAIIMLEGNDVASGLKWALLSQSIVLMPQPKHTSWAMEELLEPWVHYVPLNDEATDVEEKMQWVLENDAIARRISERATLWMEDLVFHPDALEDDRIIQEELLKRYFAHFVKDDTLQVSSSTASAATAPSKQLSSAVTAAAAR